MKDKKGITLATLIITIIVLLILAGVAISALTEGTSIADKAKNAAERYNQSAEEENNIIGELLEKAVIDTSKHIQNVSLSVDANSSSKIIINTSVEGQAVKYIYVINDEKIETTDNSYTKSDCMYGTEYKIYVMAYDSEGGVKYSDKVTTKTKDRTYLYKEGDECTSITGGWIRGNYNCGSLTKNSNHMNLKGVRSGGSDKKWNVVNTKNLINFSEYKTIYWEVAVDQCKYISGYNYCTWYSMLIAKPRAASYDNFNIISSKSYLRLNGLKSAITLNKRLTFSREIDANTSGYATAIWANYSTASNSTANLKIYNVWLEK